MHDLLLHGRPTLLIRQQGRLVDAAGKVLPDEKHDLRQDRACQDTSGDDPSKAVPIKSGAGGKTGALHNIRNSDTARVLPVEDAVHVDPEKSPSRAERDGCKSL